MVSTLSRIFQNRTMSPKYFNLIIFYIFITSSIIIVSGLNVEGVSSEDESKEDKSREKKGKKPTEYTENPAELLKTFDKTDIERQNSSSSSSNSVKTTNEPSYTTAEIALITALENACKDLKIGDLLNAGSVCRSWNAIAERESSNRGLERALLPSTFSSEISDANSDFHVWNILHSLPSVAILFFTPIALLRPPNWGNLEERTIAVYRRFFPQHLVTFSVDIAMMDENTIHSTPDLLRADNGILGLFIPHRKDIQIKVSSCSAAGYAPARCVTQIHSDLSFDSNKKTSTIIILGNMFGTYAIRYLVNLIQSSFMQKSYSLWGGIYSNKIIHSHSKDDISGDQSMVFALSLSGSNIKSWSIFFNCSKEDNEIVEKLLNFKKSLKLKQHTIGLVSGPDLEPKFTFIKEHPMKLVKKVFPNIPFLGIFNIFPAYHIGVDSLSDDRDQRLIDVNSLSLMIITYN